MTLFNEHLSDATLLLLDEGELSVTRIDRAVRHLAQCPQCTSRQRQLHSIERRLRPIQAGSNDEAHARLEASLARAAKHTPPARQALIAWQPRIALRIAAVVTAVIVSLTWWQIHSATSVVQAGSVPDRILTPGSVHPAALTDLCRLGDDGLDPEVSPEKAQEVFRSYRIQPAEQTAYQVDYLINPQLGGDDHIENLWPQPYSAITWDARAKDALERRLHSMVCGGQITLQQAQHELSTDWIAAYKKHFHTQHPTQAIAQTN